MHLLNLLLPTFENLGIFAYWVIFLAAFLESLAVVGSFIPGGTMVILAGFLSAHGFFDVGDLIWYSALGAILGDIMSYYLGTRGIKFFHDKNKFLKLSHLEKGKKFFKKYGNKSILLGRFLGPIRSIVPFIAGISGMDKKSFIIWNVVSGILWSASYVFMGYFFGGAIRFIGLWSERVSIILIIIFAVLILIRLVFRKTSDDILF